MQQHTNLETVHCASLMSVKTNIIGQILLYELTSSDIWKIESNLEHARNLFGCVIFGKDA